MTRKSLYPIQAAILLLLVSMAVPAQVGQLQGRVLLKQKDGTTVPVEGATVEAFRVDLKGVYNVRTNREGEFVYAGLPYVGTYVVAVSAPNAKASVIGDVKAGRELVLEILLEPGDGRRLTEVEALAAANVAKLAAPPRAETPNEILGRAFREGNEAIRNQKYDEAIKLYDEALAAVPHEPNVLENRSFALIRRGVSTVNLANSGTSPQRSVQIESAHRDFRDAVATASLAVEIIRNQPIPADENDRRRQQQTAYFAFKARAEAMRLLVSQVDPSQATVGLAAFQDYINVEEDPNKRSKAALDAAQMLLESKSTNLAIDQYRQILVREPDSIDALAGLGLAVYQSGDKARFIEAAGYLQRFMEQAPATHSMRPSVAEVLRKLNSPQ
jgi:tetratricopeptide (TPR) repeat protein